MKYVIEDYDLSNLPEAQFGVAFCFNMFFVKNLDFIFNWAIALKKVLRPGGYFMFNFVPSNTSWGLELAEDFRFTAIDHERLASMLVEAGFEIVETEIRQTLASTMLIKMPGELKTFKLTGSLARIIDKSEPFV
jgi:predicted TPR repeat methyltransferase